MGKTHEEKTFNDIQRSKCTYKILTYIYFMPPQELIPEDNTLQLNKLIQIEKMKHVIFIIYLSLRGDIWLIKQQLESKDYLKSKYLNLSKSFYLCTLQHVKINNKLLIITTNEAELIEINLQGEDMPSENDVEDQSDWQLKSDKVDLTRLTRPESTPYFKIVTDQMNKNKNTIFILSFYNGFQRVLITPYKSDLGIQLICSADITFKDIINDNYYCETSVVKDGKPLYKKLRILNVDIQ